MPDASLDPAFIHPGTAERSTVRLGPGLVDAVRAEIERARAGSALGPVTVIVPSRPSGYFLRQRLASGGLFNVQFLRIEDVADAVAGVDDGRRRLTRLQAAELVHATVSDPANVLPPELDRFRGLQIFHDAVHRTLDDLDAAAPDDAGLEPVADNGQYGAIVDLWRAFRQRAAHLSSRSDVGRAAAGRVSSDPAALRAFGRIVLLLIEEPAPQYERLTTLISRQDGVRTVIGLTGESAADVPATRLMDALPDDPQITGPPEPDETDTRLISAPDRASEARWVVGDILTNARAETPFGRMAVLFDDRAYGPRMTEALQLSGIPVAGPSPETLAQAPPGRWRLGLLSAIESGLAREPVMRWLAENEVLAPGGRTAPGAAWEAISRRAGLIGGAGDWDGRLQAYAARLRSRADNAERIAERDETQVASWRSEAAEAERLRAFARRLSDDASSLKSDAGWRDRVEFLSRLAGRYGAPNPDDDEDDADAGRAVESALEALADLDAVAVAPPDAARFRRSLAQELQQPASLAGRLGRGVFVSQLRRAVGCDFDLVYVVGMAEGSYPSPGTEDPLLPDAVRGRMPGMKTLALERVSARRRFLTALATAPRRVLTWPRSRAGATRLVWPARWFTEMAETLAGRTLSADLSSETELPWLTHLRPNLEGALDSRPADRHELDVRSLTEWRAAGHDPAGHPLFRGGASPIRAAATLERGRFYSRSFSAWDGALGDTPGWAARSLDGATSPTRLETWATCPFRYFLAHELEVESSDAPEEADTINPLDRGTLVHDILRRFVAETIERPDRRPDANAQADRLAAIAAEEMDSFERGGLVGRPILWRLERERITRGLLDFLDVHRERIKSSGQSPVATEMGFGFDDATPPVEVVLDGGMTIVFRGRIDRVDLSADGRRATVIDYKSGHKSSYTRVEKDPVDAGRHLQLPVYGLALRRARPEIEHIDAEFWFVMDAAGSARISASLDVAEERMRTVAPHVVAGIEAGLFPANPGQGFRPNAAGTHVPDNCAYCPYDRICPGNRDWLWERKQADPANLHFMNLALPSPGEGT